MRVDLDCMAERWRCVYIAKRSHRSDSYCNVYEYLYAFCLYYASVLIVYVL